MPTTVKTVPCPRCGIAAPFSPENKWRPFCSERCKIIDLGDWANERYRVPVHEKENAQSDPMGPDSEPEEKP